MNFVIVVLVLLAAALELWLKAEENGLTAPPGPVIPPAKPLRPTEAKEQKP